MKLLGSLEMLFALNACIVTHLLPFSYARLTKPLLTITTFYRLINNVNAAEAYE